MEAKAAAPGPSPLYYSYDVAGAHVLMLGTYAPYRYGRSGWLGTV